MNDNMDLTDGAIQVGLALFHAARAGSDTSVHAIASATNMSVDQVSDTIRPLLERRLIRPSGFRGPAIRPIDWTRMTDDDWTAVRGTLVLKATAFLPAALEGRLDYSPAEDDARVASATESVEPEDFPNHETLAARLGIPAIRVSEAYTREAWRTREVGMRMRIVLEVTFPDVAPDDSRDWTSLLRQTIEEGDRIPCQDVRIMEATGIGFAEDASEYDRWESRRNGDVPPDPHGPGLRSLF